MPIELSYQQAEELLESVVHNKKLVKVDSKEGEKLVVLSYPTAHEIFMSRYVRASTLKEAEEEDLPSREDIDKLIEERGITGSSTKDQIDGLEEKLFAQRRLLALTKIQARRKPIEEVIEKLEEELAALKAKGEHLYALTREFRADEGAMLYLTWAATYNIGGEKYWKTFEDFENEKDLIFRTSVVEQYAIMNRGFSVAEIRFLARHVLWRIKYTAALKVGGSLFPGSLYDLTPDQQALLYWSSFYQSVYEMLPDDQPDDETIQDDDALDEYMESYFKRRDAERNEGRLKRGSRRDSKLSAGNADEVIITANHPDYLAMSYSEKRVKGAEGVSDIEVVSPDSRRARNRRAARRGN